MWFEISLFNSSHFNSACELNVVQAVDQVVAAGVLFWIASSAAEACGQAAGLGGIELGKGVAHEQDFGGRYGERVGDL